MSNANLIHQEEDGRIQHFVDVYRKRYDINEHTDHEPTFFNAADEGHQILFKQLITTPEDTETWRSLEDRSKRNLVLSTIKNLIRQDPLLFDRDFVCSNCVIPENYEGLSVKEVDGEKFCHHCTDFKKQETLGEKRLLEELAEHEGKIGVCVSGGKDSVFVWMWLVEKFGADNVVAFNHNKDKLTHSIAIRNLKEAEKVLKSQLVIINDEDFFPRYEKNHKILFKEPDAGIARVLLCAGCRFGITGRLFLEAQKMGITVMLNGSTSLELAPFKSELLKKKVGNNNFREGLISELSKKPDLFFGSNIETILLDELHCHSTLGNGGSKNLYPHIKYLEFYTYYSPDPDYIANVVKEKLNWTSPAQQDWRFDCLVGTFKSLVYYGELGYTEADYRLSEMIREGLITRDEALERIKQVRLSSKETDGVFHVLEESDMDNADDIHRFIKSSPYLFSEKLMYEKLIIKPHHFIDVMKLHGRGLTHFVPDENFGHDFFFIGNLVLNSPNTTLVLTADADDICSPCKFLKDGKCTDSPNVTGFSDKNSWNAELDKRILTKLNLADGQSMTAKDFAHLLLTHFKTSEDYYEIWKPEEVDVSQTQQREKDLSNGLTKYLKGV